MDGKSYNSMHYWAVRRDVTAVCEEGHHKHPTKSGALFIRERSTSTHVHARTQGFYPREVKKHIRART